MSPPTSQSPLQAVLGWGVGGGGTEYCKKPTFPLPQVVSVYLQIRGSHSVVRVIQLKVSHSGEVSHTASGGSELGSGSHTAEEVIYLRGFTQCVGGQTAGEGSELRCHRWTESTG